MSYTLTYFNAKARAEIPRLLFAAAKVPYTDKRFPIDFSNGSKPEFDAEKATGVFDFNFGTLPVLTVVTDKGTLEIGQSKTIERYLARKFGFFGANEEEGALIDMIGEHTRDIKLKYNEAKAGKKGEQLAEAKNTFVTEGLPVWFGKLEKSLSGNGFAVGSKLSLADFAVFDLVKDYFDDKDGAYAATANTPKIRASVSAAETAVQDWLRTRPDTKF